MSNSDAGTLDRRLRRSDPSTIQDKFLVGYQGWFTCGGDGEPIGPGHHGWLHWFNSPLPAGGRPNTDLWPDVSSYSPSELYPAPGLKTKAGEQVFLFSSRNAKTVQRHFHWMAEYGVDGAFLQRFASETDVEAGGEGIRRIRDEVCNRVREAAEKEDRVFAIMYDVSSVPADRIGKILERDWVHLVRVKGILDSPNYLQEKGRPVIGLWGFGFNEAGHTPSLLRSIISTFRNITPGGAYIMAGVPAYWRTSEGDADRNPEFLTVWLNEVDAISPWTIGRYSSEREADRFAENMMRGDSEFLRKRVDEGFKKIDYVPVVFPGGSGYNLSQGNWEWNGIKRDGGRFLWKQIYNAQKLGVRTMYGAMWDEYDEGTAFIPVVTHKRFLPVSDEFKFMALDEDGYDLPADWYMRISGFAAEALRGERRVFETFPLKELQDYWSCRPKYEELSALAMASGSWTDVDTTPKKPAGQSYEEWLSLQNDRKEEAPPPPYSLEAEQVPSNASTTTAPSTQVSVNAGIARTSSLSTSDITRPTSSTNNPTTNLPPPEHPSRTPRASDAVSSLANELGRVNISHSSSVHLHSTAGVGRLPPPVPNMNTRPSPRPEVNIATRPTNLTSAPPSGPPFEGAEFPYSSSTGSLHTASGYPSPTRPSSHPAGSLFPSSSVPPHQEVSAKPGLWSQAQWPPVEWKVNDSSHALPTVVTSRPVYDPSEGIGGANLTRPHTISSGHRHSQSPAGGANLRPSVSVGGGGGRPNFGSGTSACLVSKESSDPGYPSGSPDCNPTYFGHHTSMYPGQQTFHRPPPQSPGFVRQPIPYPYPTSPTPSDDPLVAGHHAGYRAGYPPPSHPPQPFPQFPDVPSGAMFLGPGRGYFPQPQMDQQPQFLQHNPGPWVPMVAGGSAPPTFPPRPDDVYGRVPMGGGPGTSGGTSQLSAFGLAMSAVDKVAGKKTREQIEAAGSKLFGRLR